jgi:protein-S-isoprenylcysteine O-methyltransferase Ste14
MQNANPAEPIPPTPDKPPVSCVGWMDALVGLVAMFGLFFGLRQAGTLSDAALCAVMVAGLAFFVGLVEIARAPWRRTAPVAQKFSEILKRAAIKYAGFLAGLGFIGFLYWLFPEYHRDFYKQYMGLVLAVAPFLPLIFAAYFLFAEWRFPPEKDHSWHMGMLVLGNWKEVEAGKVQQNILAWLVKGHFLAIMVSDLVHGVTGFRHADWNLFNYSFMEASDLLFAATVTFELVFVSAGYACACRLFNSQIRVVESTLLGWFIALISYAPLLGLIYTNFFGYRGGNTSWKIWLAGNDPLLMVWGAVLLALLLVHMWGDACFGVRFSNLTNRGIITNGPYRFMKHPAYFSKSLRWWLVSAPFATTAGWDEALRYSLMLAGVNIAYAVRCYTEERLLSSDPNYVAYALWMDEHGWLGWIGKIFPFMSYAWRLKRWRMRGELQPMVKGAFD